MPPTTPPLGRLLVANRGEIAVRIMDAAAALGVPSVAVYAADDAGSAHARLADEAVPLDGSGPAAYLDAAAIVEAAARTGCDAVHPGYGFLSENAAFAERCEQAGLTFVGPGPETLRLLGDKTRARRLARDLGIPLLDATEGPTDLATARAFLDDHGAVMVKAVAGGGGRGMRPVSDPAALPEAFERAASEAERAFGDGSLYVERLLRGARHIEVQIVGDGTGAVVHLADRDCGLQRRRQKLIEIAPAPDLDPDVAARLREAALALGRALSYRGAGTVEFLVAGTEVAFLEVNPRVQVEHTVTEEVTGVDLIETGLLVAGGATLAGLGLASPPAVRGIALQARVNTETLLADGTVRPASGTLTRFEPPTGRNVRVDTHGRTGDTVGPRYDPLLAKVIVTDPGGSPRGVARRASRALAAFAVEGVDTNLPLLRALLDRPELGTAAATTDFVEAHLAELTEAAEEAPGAPAVAPSGTVPVLSPQQGVVVEVSAAPGDAVPAGTQLLVLEAMKMEHVVTAPVPGIVRDVPVKAGDVVPAAAPVAFLEEDAALAAEASGPAEVDLDRVRPDLAETVERHRVGLDEGRPAAVRRRHDAGRRTARENLADLCDPGSFTEYGALAIAAQRRRRSLEDLIANTPADGLVAGTATIGGRPCAVMSYDYTVLAGTQGLQNHRKTDRLLDVAARRGLPLVIFAEGGGGRPGDTDTASVAGLDVTTFRMAAALSGRVPTVAIVSGYCFAGNAALAGVCDVIIATEEASLGMGGPAMIEGGGLGVVAPGDVGPMPVQAANGVVDLLVPDDAAAVAAARRYLSYFAGPVDDWDCADQRLLRHLVPENRLRVYDVRPVIETLADTGSVLELRAGFGAGIVTALARIGGIPVGIIANDPRHLGGAIDGDAADKATRFLTLCQSQGLPVVSLCDTPGFMVGPETERTGAVRRFGAMFVAGARLTVPVCMVVLRKGYGLGAMAMAGGDFKAPLLTVSWPTGEFGGMGLEGAVRLGYRKELEAIDDPAERQARYEELVAESYERGKALSMAAAFEIDDVIDPAETRTVLVQALTR
ncbi:pyruvate carboxylase [Actinomadura sp. NBRC 104412]|uniref:acetyl-CoA carboxylase family protein n=1 Tax=Actinomadura sp. NBRC 104412 TaxID=3032203 RepID=UPI0024A1763D|nr:carboxyl transferase domain-containing protein [Actinomadura sp. NBRC 104412]GLZ02799.1 pyruvate carboxylase [Actinomadura sp. NBRC 104412]